MMNLNGVMRNLGGETGKKLTNTKHSCPTTSYSLVDCNAQNLVGLSHCQDRKRQRRQAAGNLVSTLFGGNANNQAGSPSDPNSRTSTRGAGASSNRKKASQAQPRPSINIPPRGIGPIHDPNCNDVLSGRGGRINAHIGNVQFRNLVYSKKKQYLDLHTKKLEKAHIAAEIVRYVRTLDPPGRFLKEDADGAWYDIGDAKAIKKVGQALREDAPEVRQEFGGLESPTEANPDISKSLGPTRGPGDSSDDEADQLRAKLEKVDGGETSADKTVSMNSAAKFHDESNMKQSSVRKKTVTPTSQHGSKLPPQQSINNNPVVTKSGRGGKTVITSVPVPRQQVQPASSAAFQTLAYQEIAPPPSYKSMGPSKNAPRVQLSQQRQQQARLQQQQQHASFSHGHGRGGGPIIPSSGASVSGAAAAVMQEQFEDEQAGHFEVTPTTEEAFGMLFHSPPRSIAGYQKELSNVSGLSGPSNLSGMSAVSMNVSALTDPISTISGRESRRAAAYSQQHNIASMQAVHSQQDNIASMQTAYSQQHNIASMQAVHSQQHNITSMQTAYSQQHNIAPVQNSTSNHPNAVRTQNLRQQMLAQQYPSISTISGLSSNMAFDTSSFAAHSLMGGALREDSATTMDILNTFNVGNGGGASVGAARDDSMLAGGSTIGSAIGSFTGAGSVMSGMSFGQLSIDPSSKQSITSRGNGHPQQYFTGMADASVASMSMNSVGSLQSIPASVMSDLSENLIALDLAEPKGFDRRLKPTGNQRF